MLAVAALVSAPLTGSLMLLRVLVVATAVGAASSAVLLRLRDRAGELELEAEVSARARDEARFEDRVAELEYQVETAEEQVKRLERRVLAQRSQLARAEGDNQRLLRERARVAAEHATREAEQARRREAAVRGIRPTATAYLKAASVLRGLERRAAVGQAQRIAAKGSARALEQAQAHARSQAQARPTPAQPAVQLAVQPPQAPLLPQPAARPQPQARPEVAASAPAAQAPAAATPAVQAPAQEPIVAQGPAWARAALPPLRPAVSILPATLQRGAVRGVAQPNQPAHGTSSGTFNFFSRQEDAISTDLGGRVPADLADVVGDEAAAEQHRYDAASQAGAPADQAAAGPAGPGADSAAHDRSQDAAGADTPREDGLVDLTAEDETEPIDVRVLRAL